MISLLHLSSPTVGGWITYSSHLVLRDYPNEHIIKVGKRLEKKLRPFGFGIHYQNIPKEAVKTIQKPIVLSFDNHFEDVIPYLNEPVLLMHDTAEPKKRLTDFYKSCKRIIVNRKTLQTFLKEEYDLKSDHVEHPFYQYPIPKTNWNKKTKAKNIARVEFRKNQDIICKANHMIKNPIEIWGKRNQIYVYQKLKALGFDKWSKGGKSGKYANDFKVHNDLLEDCKFVVDLAKYVRDGGGMQYTFLEAIYQDSALILNRDWVEQPDSDWKEGYNCLAVSNEKELADIINDSPNTEKMCRNAKKLLKKHIESRFEF